MLKSLLRRILNTSILVSAFFLFGGTSLLYNDILTVQKNKQINKINCQKFYDKPIEHTWIELSNCRISFEHILENTVSLKRVKLKKTLLLPLAPENYKGSPIIYLNIDDKKIVTKYNEILLASMKPGNKEIELAGEMIVLFWDYQSKPLKGLIRKKTSKRISNSEGTRADLEYFPFEINVKPEIRSSSLNLFLYSLAGLIVSLFFRFKFFKK